MGTHPIFESDFDCLTDVYSESGNMPPKAQTSKKADAKRREKLVEDKTFGLKNKKGAKQQKYIGQVEKNCAGAGMQARKLALEKKKAEEKKLRKQQEQEELLLLFGKTAPEKKERAKSKKVEE